MADSIPNNFGDDKEGDFKRIPINAQRAVKTTIESSFENVTQKVEELIDNSKDASATKAELALLKKRNLIVIFDDGMGITHEDKVVTWASDHKEQENRRQANPDSTGTFGEGGKSILSVANYLIYKSNNGQDDVYVRLRRVPSMPKEFEYMDYVSHRSPKGDEKEELGTVAYVLDISLDNINDVQKHIKDSAGYKFAWLIAKGDFRIPVKILDEKENMEEEYDIPVPERLKLLFNEEFPKNVKNIGRLYDEEIKRDVLIEAIAIKGVKPSQRKIIYARKHRIIKEVKTRRDVMIIVNFDSTKILKDRRSFDMNHAVTSQYLALVDDYVAANFDEPYSPYETLNDQERNKYFRVLKILDKLADLNNLTERKRIQKSKQKPIRVKIPEDQTKVDAYMKTTRKEEPAVIMPEKELLKKPKGTRGPDENKKKREKKDKTKLKTGTTLVSRTKLVGDKLVHAIGINIDLNEKEHIQTFFDIMSREFEEEKEKSWDIATEHGKCTVLLNELGNYFRSKKPKTFPYPKFELEDQLPLVADAVAYRFFGDQNLSHDELQMKSDEILNAISIVYLDEKEYKKQYE